MASQDSDVKLVKGLSQTFVVDGFAFAGNYGKGATFFLTHYHSDHTVLRWGSCGIS